MLQTDAELRLARLERQAARERAARAEAERLLESKSLELHEANLRLQALNAELESRVQARTEEVEAQRRLTQIANERMSLATASGRIGIWDFDIGTGQLIWDALTYELYGLTPETGTGNFDMWQQRVHPDDRAQAAQTVWAAISAGTRLDLEFRVVWPDGSIHHLRGTGRVKADKDGRPAKMVGVVWDVTEARQLTADLRRFMALRAEAAEREILARSQRDAAERAARAKSEFLATMSHEIRSPMSGLLGVLELLRATPLEIEQKRMADMVHNSASMLLAVLNDVLDFSKIEAGALAVEKLPTRLRGMMDDLVQPHLVSARHKGIKLTCTIDPAVPDWVLTDKLRVQQIVGNLLSNARKFTAAGEIAVRMKLAGSPGGGGETAPLLQIDVQDSGIGMAADVVSRLFNPFMQADGSTTRTYGGTGLGLAISKKLAALLDGTLSVTSEPGVGSIFTLRLKLLPCAAENLPAADAPAAPAALARPGQIVLVVDDDQTIRWLSERQLKNLGFEVDVAKDGEEGLQQFQRRTYDLVLTDCHMPRMDGVAMTQSIRALEQDRARKTPIIGLTADVTEAQRIRCRAAGMSDIAIKPLTIPRLASLIAHHLGATLPKTPALPEPAPQADAVFDDSIFETVFEPGDPAGAAWLNTYLTHAREDLVILETCFAAKPRCAAHIAEIAHRLAGASYSAGATATGAAARALENAAKASDDAALTRALPAVKAALAEAETAIGRHLARSLALVS